MNRAQRRAAQRGAHVIEICLSGCCAPAGPRVDGPYTGEVSVWEGHDGRFVIACPGCDSDVPLPQGMPSLGDVWKCSDCGLSGMLMD